jgi:hypothetical protein
MNKQDVDNCIQGITAELNRESLAKSDAEDRIAVLENRKKLAGILRRMMDGERIELSTVSGMVVGHAVPDTQLYCGLRAVLEQEVQK